VKTAESTKFVLTARFLNHFLKGHYLLGGYKSQLTATENADRLTDSLTAALNAYLGSDCWTSPDAPVSAVVLEAYEEQIAGLKEEIAWATKEAREWRERCETMADEFKLLAHDAVSIEESYALSHAEKRGAFKHWRVRVWKSIQENRYPRNMIAKDSDIPF